MRKVINMYKKVFIFSGLCLFLMSIMSCNKTVKLISESTYSYESYTKLKKNFLRDADHVQERYGEEGLCKSYGIDDIVYDISLRKTSDNTVYLYGEVKTPRHLDYVKITEVKIECETGKNIFSVSDTNEKILKKNENFKQSEYYAEEYNTYHDGAFSNYVKEFSVGNQKTINNFINTELKKAGKNKIKAYISYEAKEGEQIFTYTDTLENACFMVEYEPNLTEWYVSCICGYVITVIILVLILIFQKKEKKEWIYVLLAVFFGDYGFHNIYGKEYKKMGWKFLLKALMLPCEILFIYAVGNIIKEPMYDQYYGLVFISLLGWIIPALISEVLVIVDIIMHFTSKNKN